MHVTSSVSTCVHRVCLEFYMCAACLCETPAATSSFMWPWVSSHIAWHVALVAMNYGVMIVHMVRACLRWCSYVPVCAREHRSQRAVSLNTHLCLTASPRRGNQWISRWIVSGIFQWNLTCVMSVYIHMYIIICTYIYIYILYIYIYIYIYIYW